MFISHSGLKMGPNVFAFAGVDQKQLDRMDPNVLTDPLVHPSLLTQFYIYHICSEFKAFWAAARDGRALKARGSSRLAILLLRLWLRPSRITFKPLSQPIAGGGGFALGLER